MARIGVSKPYYGIYNAVDSTVTYTQGAVMGKATQVDVEIQSSDGNDLYGDNAVAETDRQFTSGTLTVATTDLSQEVNAVILGMAQQMLEQIPGVTDANVRELIADDRQETPYLGVGFVIKKKVNGVIWWRAVIFTKIMFSVPSESTTTQGQTISWQVPSLSATIMRDDSSTHMWKREATFSSEAQAEAYLKKRLGVGVEPELGELTVQSTAGETSGKTAIAVSPPLSPSGHYVYQVNTSVTLPTEYGEDVGAGWTAWDGVSEIAATDGQQIGIVEANLDNQAMAAGLATVVANGG